MTFTEFFQLAQIGISLPMLWLVWKAYLQKDSKSYAAVKEHTEDIKKINASTQELVVEVTAALVNKNHTDEKMAKAIEKLTEQLRKEKGS